MLYSQEAHTTIKKNRQVQLSGEQFTEYMFEKYKNEDTENMGYFDILNTIDSELREFEKRM